MARLYRQRSVDPGRQTRGTRLSAGFLLGLFAEGWTEEAVPESYPQVSREALRAVFAFAQECTRDQQVFAVSPGGRLRFLANENIPLPGVRALRRAGHDAVSISERSPGIPDDEVVRIARAENRLIVTFDRDYGELVFRRGLPVPSGILYLRFLPSMPEDVAAYVLRPIETGIAVEGRFTTADRGGVRQVILRRVGEIDSD